MSSRISLTVVVLTIAIVLSAAAQQPWQAVLSAAQPGDDPFGGDDDPAGKTDVDPFAVKPKESKPSAEPAKTKTTKRVPTAKYRSGEEVIEGALRQMTQMDGIIEMPLGDMVDFLSEYHEISILIDGKTLEDVDAVADTPITIDVKGVPLRSALDLVLRQVDLTWTIHSDVLLITTSEQAETLLTTRVYDVGDLVTFRDEKGERWEDYDTLTESITTTIVRESWSDCGGLGAIAGGTFGTAKVISVSNTYRVHRQIAEFLGQLREIAAKKPGDGQPPMKRRPPPVDFGNVTIPVVGGPGGDGQPGHGGMGGGGLF